VKMPPPLPKLGNINMAADEPISIPLEKPEPVKEMFASVENTWTSSMEQSAAEEKKKEAAVENNLEEKLESLQSLLEKKLAPPQSEENLPKEAPMDENFKFIKMIYSILLDNEVDEKYVNQIMDEVEKVMKGGASVDLILSSIYQKMILKFGQPQPIELTERKPKVVFFIGPTGVGKTTTIAKIASRFKMEKGKKVALFTADTYRIAAAEQLRTYANIMDTPLSIVYSSEELNEKLRESEEYDLVLIDTAGFSHKNAEQRNETRKLIDQVPGEYQKEVYLVLSATTKYRDLIDIADIYRENFQFKLIFTKLDETSCYGNILNMKLYTGSDLSYSTYGQNVPEDIEVFNTQKIVKLLLGGK
ncbi:MAG: DEAD/DEAH box helicase family protein, partial [Lachnospiraceae bacterium]|nr:DEAD/DEAH box helicase family protein [Lachnospiraceae bacterium]